MTRSSHIAVKVSPARVEEAVAHYKALLSVRETSRKPDCIELSGENFKLFVEPSESPVVLQEFVAPEGKEARKRFEEAGCRIFDESDLGFHVEDPYGLSFHVWTEAGSED